MNREFTRGRRFAVVAFALICSALLFRREVATALIVRGDDYLYRGDVPNALERYRRAFLLDPASETAADRYTFVSMQHQDRTSLQRAIDAAGRFLRTNPNDAPVLRDRALCYLHARRYSAAEKDFERSARVGGSADDYVFAGWAARHAGRHKEAIALWERALHLRPGYRPAVVALTEVAR